MAKTSTKTSLVAGRDLTDGETFEMQGSASKPYVIKNTGGVYACTCAAWRNQSTGVIRTCKHIRKLRGDEAEEARLGAALSKPAPERKTTAPPCLLANVWKPDMDPTGWWMSEKLDGVRAWWDGKKFISRLGNVYYAPDWFIEDLPTVPLDGELWLDRGAFQKCISIVRRQDKNDEWKKITYTVFDAPQSPGTFEERQAYLAALLSNKVHPYHGVLTQKKCKGFDHLQKELERVERLGGEGLMLRQPGSLYEAGRSSTLLKVKSFMDSEAVVIAHEPGKGKHKGRLGALVVRMSDDTQFSVGTGFTDKERENPPAIGSTITFRFQELSDAGVPRFPSFVRVRPTND
jgi:DNA ligase-1